MCRWIFGSCKPMLESKSEIASNGYFQVDFWRFFSDKTMGVLKNLDFFIDHAPYSADLTSSISCFPSERIKQCDKYIELQDEYVD